MPDFSFAQLEIAKGATEATVTVTFLYRFTEEERKMIENDPAITISADVVLIGDDSPWPSETLQSHIEELPEVSPFHVGMYEGRLEEEKKKVITFVVPRSRLNEDRGLFNKEDEIIAMIRLGWVSQVNVGLINYLPGSIRTNKIEDHY